MAGLSLLGLLVTVAIVLILFNSSAEKQQDISKQAKKQIKKIEKQTEQRVEEINKLIDKHTGDN